MNLMKRLIVITALLTPAARADFLDDYENKEPHFLELLDESPDSQFDLMNELVAATSPTLKLLDPCIIVDLLVTIGAIPILEQDFFLSTNRPARRSLLDMPLFQINKAVFPCPSFLNTQLFFDITPNARFTRTSNNINSYIATSDETLLGAIDAAIKKIQPLAGNLGNINVRSILDIISTMTLVERNIGFMFQTGGRWDRLQFRIMFPFYYHERNFFLSNNDLDQLALELGFLNPDTFDDSYAICDRLGLGDTRLEFGVHAIEKQWCDMVLSVYATIPTAFTIKSGMAGSKFTAPGTYPSVDFDFLYNTIEAMIAGTVTPEQQAQSFLIMRNFFLNSWERVGAALLDNGMGNESHVGIGACMAIDARLDQWICKPWASCMYWHNRVALEYMFQNDTTRFYINKNDPASFDRDFESMVPEVCKANLDFLQNEIINRICLLGLSTEVRPGIIGMWKSIMAYQDYDWNAYFGTDFWFQTKEKHGCIHATQDLIKTLDVCKSVMPWAFQNKLIGGFGYTHHTEQCTMTFGLDGDVTLFTTGLGRNYMVTLRLDAQF